MKIYGSEAFTKSGVEDRFKRQIVVTSFIKKIGLHIY